MTRASLPLLVLSMGLTLHAARAAHAGGAAPAAPRAVAPSGAVRSGAPVAGAPVAGAPSAVRAFSPGGGAAGAGTVASMVDHSSYNGVQLTLNHLLVEEQSRLHRLAASDTDLRPEEASTLRTGVILVTNLYMRGMLSAEQQVAHDRDVLQVERFRPGGEWKRVLAQKPMLRALLNVKPEQDARIRAAVDAYRDGWSEIARNRATTPLQKGAAHTENGTRLAAAVRKLLTPAQRAEFNAFLNGFAREMAEVSPYRVTRY